MFSYELKFVIDILKKCFSQKYFRRFKGLDFLTKQKFKRENPISWDETNCVICVFCLPTSASSFPNEKMSTYLDFVIVKEHAFIRNVFDHVELKQSKSIKAYEKHHESFRKMFQVVVLLNTSYSNESDIEDISDDCIAKFVSEMNVESFSDLFLQIEIQKLKILVWKIGRILS